MRLDQSRNLVNFVVSDCVQIFSHPNLCAECDWINTGLDASQQEVVNFVVSNYTDVHASKFVCRVRLDQHRTGRIAAGSGEVCTGSAGGSSDPWPTRHGQNHHCGGGDPAGCPQRGQGEVRFKKSYKVLFSNQS